jgi:voltage-gated potassium channel
MADKSAAEPRKKGAEPAPLVVALRRLYHGRDRTAVRFRFALLTFDLVTIGFFVASSTIPLSPWLFAADLVIAGVLSVDLLARLAIAPRRLRFVSDPVTVADVVVIGTLVASPFIDNWAFLRVLRAMRLLRSYHVIRDLRRRFPFFSRNQDIIQAVLNLAVFLFVITALVYVTQHPVNPQIRNYVDALYFTVTTLTTTGFGDITLTGDVGRLLAVVIMVMGVALFLRLVQAIFRPAKVNYHCPDCGLKRHDPDAVHCKHCGRTLPIDSEGY